LRTFASEPQVIQLRSICRQRFAAAVRRRQVVINRRISAKAQPGSRQAIKSLQCDSGRTAPRVISELLHASSETHHVSPSALGLYDRTIQAVKGASIFAHLSM